MKQLYLYIYVVFVLVISSCSPKTETIYANALLYEPCMLVNTEQDNTIEGNYLRVSQFYALDSTIEILLPPSFFVTTANCSNWIIGWGTNAPLYDSGSENLREILSIDSAKHIIYLGNIKRGKGFPEDNQRIVFYNKNPSGYKNTLQTPIINTTDWLGFKGKSTSFSSIQFDSILHTWVMVFNECDTSFVNIYAATSDNLINWKPANNGLAILTEKDFKLCEWAGRDATGNIMQTPFVSDVLFDKGTWYLFLDGYDRKGKRNIGMATSKTTLLGPYNISNEAIIKAGEKNSWNDASSFYAKVTRYHNEFIMAYDGRNSNGLEQVGLARSADLVSWKNDEHNPVINQHTGWRSSVNCSEPNSIEMKNDTLLVMLSGVKKSKANFWHHYVTKRMYMDVSGNVEQTELGIYTSVDNGKTFLAHKNNPVFINDFSNPYENAHLGGNFKAIHTDTMDYIFYQAKSTYQGLKYNIMLRTKPVK